MSRIQQQGRAYLYAGLAIFFWSTVATAFKIGLRNLGFLELVLYSSFFSWLVYFLFIVFQGRWQELLNIRWRHCLSSAFLGFLNPFLYYVILFKAYSLLPAQVAQPVNMIWPIVLVFLSVPLLGQKVRYKSYVALFMGFTGVWLIASQGDLFSIRHSSTPGLVLAVGSSLVWSLYWIFNVKDTRNEESKLFINFMFATLYIFIVCLLTGQLHPLTFKALAPAAYIGIFEMGVSFLFWLKAMKLTSSNDRISTLVYLAPFLSLVFIHFILGEHIYLTTVSGLVIIVAGILFQKISFKEERRETNKPEQVV